MVNAYVIIVYMRRIQKMNDSEKLDLILEELKSLKVQQKDLQQNQKDLQQNQEDLKIQLMKSTAELKAMDSLIFDEVERVHGIMLKRTDELSRKIG